MEQTLTPGQRIADKTASFGGNWIFIISLFTFIVIWMLINICLLSTKAFDPYPFILLNNLLLSCVAAIQKPIIMISQNRKEEKNRK